MKEEFDKTYNKYIDKIIQFEPQLESPSDLTQEIIHQIKIQESMPQPILKHSLFILRPMLSTAAVFLLALFLYQFYSVPEKSNRGAITISKSTTTVQKTILANNEKFVEDSIRQKIFECFIDTLNIDCFSEALTYYYLYKENARLTIEEKITNSLNKKNYEIN